MSRNSYSYTSFLNRSFAVFLFVILAWIVFPQSLAFADSRPTELVGAAQVQKPLIFVLSAEGPLTPSMIEYLKRGLKNADQRGAELLIFQLDTPGGGTTLMNQVVQDIRESSVPVVVYIAPNGAMAGSAGVLITLAAHVSAMAPVTAIGAASPVGMQGEDLGETIQSKEKNILKATVRSLAETRPEQAIKLAEAMIESADALSASEALEVGLVDFIARDLDDLLRQLDGWQVETATGKRVLNTSEAELQIENASFIEELLSILTNPNIVFLLLTIGVQAILIELSNPGGWVAGFIGAVLLALAAYGLGVLDVNWFGIIFLIIAFALFILDIKAPTHGALTAAGVISLIVGSLVLFNSPSLPAFQPRVSIPFVVIVSLSTGGFFLVILLYAIRSQRVPVRVGADSLAGQTGHAITDINPHGLVQLASERWTAELVEGEPPIAREERIEVVYVSGLRLIVRKK